MSVYRTFCAGLVLGMLLPGTCLRASTTGTVGVHGATPSIRHAALVSPTASKPSTTGTVLLIGDQPHKPGSTTEQKNRKKEKSAPVSDNLTSLTLSEIGGNVIDETSAGQTVARLQKRVPEFLAKKPAIVVLFAGAADEAANTPDDAQQKGIASVMSALASGGAKVFVVPGSTGIGAATSANLRLGAEQGNGTFIDLGTEIGGHPVRTALDSVATAVTGKSEMQDTGSLSSQEAISPEMPVVKAPETEKLSVPTEAASSNMQKGDAREVIDERQTLKKELSRAAGQLDAQSAQETSAVLSTGDIIVPGDAGTTVSPDGLEMVKRGAAAQETINMRPLPPVKAFRPQAPVPRNDLRHKAPALSRE